ncbi:hypothetical protein TRIP_B10023 [uncultured Desulfatiglans sp.]|nr:hypothetical protein TRIP_B10023 [uncultured Desulfatiglans sp.]
MVAVGNLDKIWSTVPEDAAESDLKKAFRSYFGAEWTEVLDGADQSFGYHASNNVYFAVREVRLVEELTLEQLLEEKGAPRPPDIIVS